MIPVGTDAKAGKLCSLNKLHKACVQECVREIEHHGHETGCFLSMQLIPSLQSSSSWHDALAEWQARRAGR